MSAGVEEPKFEVVSIPLAHPLSEGEHVISVDCQSGTMAQLTSSGRLTVRDLENDEEEIVLSSMVKNPHRVFVHPSGEHIVVTATDGDVFYYDPVEAGKELKTSLCKRNGNQESGIPVGECVEWLEDTSPDGVTALIGSRSNGLLFEVRFRPRQREGTVRLLVQLPLRLLATKICNLFCEVREEYSVVMVSTPVQLFRVCSATRRAIDALLLDVQRGVLRFDIVSPHSPSAEGVASGAAGSLSVFRSSPAAPSHAYLWCTSWGILHGLFFKDGSDLWENERWVVFTTGEKGESVVNPVETTLLGFHMVLRCDTRVLVLHQPAGLPWRPAASGASSESTKNVECVTPRDLGRRIVFDPFGDMGKKVDGLVRDVGARRHYIVCSGEIWQLAVYNEHLQQCKFFLERAVDSSLSHSLRSRLYDAAFKLSAGDPVLQDTCALLKAQFQLLPPTPTKHAATDTLLNCGSFEKAFRLLARNGNVGLQVEFLRKKFVATIAGFNQSSQQWSAAQVAQASRLLLLLLSYSMKQWKLSTPQDEVASRIKEVLTISVKESPLVWKEASFYSLVLTLLEGEEAEQGETLSLFLSKLLFDYPYMVNRLISLNRRREAVGVLCKYCHSATELVAAWYTHLPSLMRSYPVELTNGLVKCMMKDAHAGRPILLEVDRLLPILLNYEVSFNEDGSTENRVLYFLEHCIFRFDYPSPAVHNYYIYLLAKEKDEERLYEALTSSLFYDPEYALRVCVERGCKKVSFTLYKKLELYEHALRYLLENSEPQQEQWRELTFVEEMLRGLASKLSHDRAKNLWLLATGYSFRKQGSKSVPQIIEHSGGLLGIEDVLQFYDNHMVVAEFKGVIQKALNQYTQDIASLNQRQKEVYETAERVKQDIASLQQQTEQVPPDATCHLCQRRINSAKSRPYVVYPGCNHIVHEGCAKKRLQNTGGLEAFVTDDGISPQLLEDVQTVTDLVYFDCVVCGEASIVELDIPLCHPDGSWDI